MRWTVARTGMFLKYRLVVPLFFLGVGYLSIAMAQSAGTFTRTGDLTTSEGFPRATLLSNGKVLITGFSTELYDPSFGTFSATGNTESWAGQSATRLADGRVLIAGGNFLNVLSTRAELYDPSTGIFTATGNMTAGRSGHKAVLLTNGKVLLVGGEAIYNTLPADITAELYDPDSGTFTATGAYAGAGLAGTATLLPDGKVLVTGYYSGLAGLYDSATGTFRPAGRAWPSTSAILLANGQVLFTGGIDDNGPSSGAGLFDPASGSFNATGSMTIPRMDHSATLLSDGTVLIAGGQISNNSGGGALSSAEIYNPASGAFLATGDMATPRFGHPAPLLPDGTTLIASGSANVQAYPGARAELYHPAVLAPSPALFSLTGDGRGQGAVWNGETGRIASLDNPVTAGDVLSMYCSNLIQGGVIPPQVAIGGRSAEILFFGDAPGYPGYYQVNFRVPSGVAAGQSVPVRLTYIGRPSNAVTIGVK